MNHLGTMKCILCETTRLLTTTASDPDTLHVKIGAQLMAGFPAHECGNRGRVHNAPFTMQPRTTPPKET